MLAVSGVALGIWQLYLNRSRWIPYRKFWMRWHHILGLAASVISVTWILSGLMSMNPFDVFSPRSAAPEERASWKGADATMTVNPARVLSLVAIAAPREIDIVQLSAQAWYRVRGAAGPADQALVSASRVTDIALPALPEQSLIGALLTLRANQAGAPVLERLTQYDHVYYAREQAGVHRTYGRPLPVWQASWADGVRIYADPASARLLLRADAGTRWQRIVYNGLHSLDFAPYADRAGLQAGSGRTAMRSQQGRRSAFHAVPAVGHAHVPPRIPTRIHRGLP